MNEHIQITPGAILFKNIPWSSELQQQLKTMLHLKDIFISSSWVTLWNMAMTPNRCYRMSAFEWTLKGCTPSGLTVRPSVLKIKCALHYMNMGDKLNIIDDANAFLFTIWFNKLRGIPWEEHWAFNKEPCTASYEMHVWWLGSSMKVDDRIYLKGIVSTWGKFMTDWQSWWVLACYAQSMREQFSR